MAFTSDQTLQKIDHIWMDIKNIFCELFSKPLGEWVNMKLQGASKKFVTRTRKDRVRTCELFYKLLGECTNMKLQGGSKKFVTSTRKDRVITCKLLCKLLGEWTNMKLQGTSKKFVTSTRKYRIITKLSLIVVAVCNCT